MGEWVEWLDLLTLEISSATLLASVLIHLALMPTSNPIKRPHKNLAKTQPIIDFLHVCIVHFLALILSVTVIGHGIGGKHIPANMARLAESQSLE